MKALLVTGLVAAALVTPAAAEGILALPSRRVGGAPAADRALAELQARVVAVAKEGAAHVGLAAIDMTNGQMISVNGSEPFPMASTVKVAIAAVFLREVQEGRLRLDAFYGMPAAERRVAGRIGDMRRLPTLTGAELLDLMLTRSDNSAADVLLAAIGGTRAVERWLAAAGVTGQRVDRSIAELLSDREARERVRVGRGRHRRWITVATPRAAVPGDRRDSSTPEAMAALLSKLRDGQLLDAQRTAYLFDVMARCRTGPRRIRGMLPAGTPVAHKTGTLDGVTNDVGVVRLPNGHDLAIAVFEQGRGGVAAQDRNIAALARLLYDGLGASHQAAAGPVATKDGMGGL